MKKTLTMAAMLAVVFAGEASAKKHKKAKKTEAVKVEAAKIEAPVMAPAAANDMSGFYLGASLGSALTNSSSKFNNANLSQQFKTQHGNFSPYMDLLVGYNHQMGSAILGAELTIAHDSKTNNLWDDNSTGADLPRTTLKKGLSYGLAARIGYGVSKDTNLYVKLGMTRIKHTLKVQSSNAVATASRRDLTVNKTRFVFTPSVGMESFVTSNMFARMEYTFVPNAKIGYANENALYSSTAAANNATSTNGVTQHIAKVSVGYKF